MVPEYQTGRGNDMSELVTEFFTATTAEDQENYFYGESQERTPSLSEIIDLAPGAYRVIDGTLCRVVSGLPTESVRDHLCAASKNAE